jgi:hypothetical protein
VNFCARRMNGPQSSAAICSVTVIGVDVVNAHLSADSDTAVSSMPLVYVHCFECILSVMVNRTAPVV